MVVYVESCSECDSSSVASLGSDAFAGAADDCGWTSSANFVVCVVSTGCTLTVVGCSTPGAPDVEDPALSSIRVSVGECFCVAAGEMVTWSAWTIGYDELVTAPTAGNFVVEDVFGLAAGSSADSLWFLWLALLCE